MAVRRDRNTGEPIEELTRKIDSSKDTEKRGGSEEKENLAGRRASGHRRDVVPGIGDTFGGSARAAGDDFSPFEAPTLKVSSEDRFTEDADRTRLVRREGEPAEDIVNDPMADPAVGWLIVVCGPGKGRVCQLGYGTNTLGRGRNSRVRLDFGDVRISRDGHATVTYDSRGRKFYLQHGGGKNLTYLGEEPVLTPTVLEAMRGILHRQYHPTIRSLMRTRIRMGRYGKIENT